MKKYTVTNGSLLGTTILADDKIAAARTLKQLRDEMVIPTEAADLDNGVSI